MAIFHDVKKIKIPFCYNTFAFGFVEKENVFEKHMAIELKTFLIIFKGPFK